MLCSIQSKMAEVWYEQIGNRSYVPKVVAALRSGTISHTEPDPVTHNTIAMAAAAAGQDDATLWEELLPPVTSQYRVAGGLPRNCNGDTILTF